MRLILAYDPDARVYTVTSPDVPGLVIEERNRRRARIKARIAAQDLSET